MAASEEQPKQAGNPGFRNSLRFRLIATTSVIVIVVLAAASTILSWTNYVARLDANTTRLQATAAMIATVVGEPLADGNRGEVLQALTAIRDLSEITYVTVTDPSGNRFAELGSGSFLARPQDERSGNRYFDLLFKDTKWLRAEIRHGGNDLGFVFLLSDVSEIRSALISTLEQNLIVILCVVLLAALFVHHSVMKATQPLAELTGTMIKIGRDGDYPEHVPEGRHDEVGALARAFNTMISGLAQRDRQLDEYRRTLEDKVRQRTSELQIARDEAQAANQAKSDFLATMSHEIRTPMNGVMVMADMLAGAPLDARHQRQARLIQQSGANMLAIINDILDLSKIEAGKLELEHAPVDPDSLVSGVTALFYDKARDVGLDLSCQTAMDVPQTISGDSTRLSQILTNLVSNAIKFTETGSVTLSVSRMAEAAAGHATLRFEVTDTGIGIVAEKQADIFGEFAQADRSTTRKYGGTGLGLSISKKLVEAMGGQIGIESVSGSGSTFWFEIPVAIITEAPDLNRVSGTEIAIVTGLSATAAHLSASFQAAGFQTHWYRDAQEALGAGLADCHGVLCDLEAVPALSSECNDAALIVLASLGSRELGGLDGAGKIKDVLYLPSSRAEFVAIADRIVTGRFAGLHGLEGHGNSEMPRFEDCHVLGVDDNEVNRAVLKDVLDSFGIRSTLVVSGREALRAMAQQRFDLVFMDCWMPEMDGFEATETIRAYEEESGSERTPIIALTAHVTGDESERWRSSGMDAKLVKPFTVAQISELLVSYCGDRVSKPDAAGARTDVAQAEPIEAAEFVPEGVSGGGVDAEPVLLSQDTLDLIATLSQGSGKNMAQRIFGMYLDTAKDQLDALLDRANHRDGAQFARAVHAFKSMSLSSGASRVADICQQMEDLAKAERADAAFAFGDELRAAFSATEQEMRDRMEDAKATVSPEPASGQDGQTSAA